MKQKIIDEKKYPKKCANCFYGRTPLDNASVLCEMKNAHFGKAFEFLASVILTECDLYLELCCLEILYITFENKSAFVEERKLIAGVLKLAK